MQNLFKFGVFCVLMVLLVSYGCNNDDSFTSTPDDQIQSSEASVFRSEPIPGQYIVVLKDNGPRAKATSANYQQLLNDVKVKAGQLVSKNGIPANKVIRSYAASIIGFVISGVTEDEIQKLRKDPAIDYIEQDQTVQINGGPPAGGSCASGTSETIPCGISLVNGGDTYTGGNKAYVLDTGIDLDHQDLNVASYGFNGTTESSLDDLNGHGSHVAGTIAAIRGNNKGVAGVAAGALVVPVKVLNKRGSGSWSGIIAGVDYVGANGTPGDVANMSLGGGASSSVDNAVINASNNGIWFLVAAGNDGANANNYSPARANGAYVRTIASMTCSGGWSSFSNFGQPPVDFIAPGSAICSTYKDGGYASLSGTSMATPHAAGVYLASGGNPSTCGTVSHSSGSYQKICN